MLDWQQPQTSLAYIFKLYHFLLCLIQSCVVWFIMGPKHKKSIANVFSKRPHQVIVLQMKLKVIKDWRVGKLVMVIAPQSGTSHSTIAMILKTRESDGSC